MSQKQKDSFLNGEGDAWFDRNAEALSNLSDEESSRQSDPILKAVAGLPGPPLKILEIGAGNGWRLGLLHSMTGAECIGVEPSARAVEDAANRYPELTMHWGTADQLPCEDGEVDLVVIGFCLYLCDREDLFRIAAECDRVLADGGRLMIIDFYSTIPHKNPYAHLADVYSYKMDYSSMFLWNPSYRKEYHRLTGHDGRMGEDPNDRLAFSVLVKDLKGGYINNPYNG